MALIFINLEQLLLDSKKIEANKSDTYLLSYKYFIYFFSDGRELKIHDLVIGSHFVYGWMPTILNLNLTNEAKVLHLLNKAKTDVRLSADEFKVVQECVNNSVVGASKLLHFINPNQYAIWDKRINRYCTKREFYGVDSVANYLEYLKALDSIEQEPGFDSFYNEVKKKLARLTPKEP